ncbi:MAG: chorismate synthase [Phycisphaerae bacterium]|nr:chorismate synthase [Phycisphaerae bacterium]
MKIVLTGPKGSGKSTVGRILAEQLGIAHVDTDELLTAACEAETGRRLTCREICREEGEPAFRAREARAVAQAAERRYCIVSTGGSSLLDPDNRRRLRHEAVLVYLRLDAEACWQRVSADGVPAFLTSDQPKREFVDRVARLDDVITPYADAVVAVEADEPPEQVARRVRERVEEELTLAAGRFSTLGLVLQVHTFGESHGPAIGAVLDGVPPGVPLSEADIQTDLDRRRPGQSAVSTPRSEADRVRILSGVLEGATTGAPIAMVIENTRQRSGDYEALRDVFRPGHADFTFWAKYGRRDHRGGGRSSGRETAARVAGGAVAKKILAERGIEIRAHAVEIGGVRAKTVDYDVVEQNPVRCADAQAAEAMEAAIRDAREAGDSVGGVIEVEIAGVPAGLGDPVFAKLDARLGAALLSVGAVKGVEFGAGFAAARQRGSEHNDPMCDGRFVTNRAGGIAGGISTGEPIVVRVAVKPTASISRPQQTCDVHGRNREIEIQGRHDPCIVPRAVPVMEAMAAMVVLDSLLIQQRLGG